MEQDENTLPVEEQPTETVVEETAVEPEEASKADDTVTVQLTPAQYRHFLKGNPVIQHSSPKPETASSPQAIEEVVLLSQGMPEDLMKELKVVAQVRGVSLLKAQADPIFVAVKEKFEQTEKHEAASLPASRGAGAPKVKKDYLTVGLSREEHKKMVLEAN